jgi:hypothetical protein
LLGNNIANVAYATFFTYFIAGYEARAISFRDHFLFDGISCDIRGNDTESHRQKVFGNAEPQAYLSLYFNKNSPFSQ